MQRTVVVRTQADLELAIKAGNIADLVAGVFSWVCCGTDAPIFIVRAGVELNVVAWGSSQPRVEARESSQPRVEARESSQPRVEAWGSSQPRVEARESSQPRVVAWGYVQLSLFGHVIATCTAKVAVLIQGKATVEGGNQQHITITTPDEWCDYYGVRVENGIATLFKAVNENYYSPRGVCYAPGETPEAIDWDGGLKECGGGLHFSPTPKMALEFYADASRFVACPVALADIVVHQNAQYPQKVKAQRVSAPCYEVNADGEALLSTTADSQGLAGVGAPS